MFGSWLNKVINGAREITRWQGKTRLLKTSDAEHMWSVSVISEGLARIEEEKFGNTVNVATLLRKAIFHDCLEVDTGDIPSGVKKKTPEMVKALENVEKIYYEEGLRKIIPRKWREDYDNYILTPKDNKKTLEGKILAAADIIDALNESIQEVKLGNKSFDKYLVSLCEDLLMLDLDSAKYFVKYCLIDFELPISAYGPKVVDFVNTYEYEKNTNI